MANTENVLEQVAALSDMRRNLGQKTLEALRGNTDSYAERLKDVADKSFMHSRLLSGTTIAGPGILALDKRSRVRERNMTKFAMYVRELPTEAGHLVMFPLRITSVSLDRRPIIDPDAREGFYSIVHVPRPDDASGWWSLSSPSDIQIDMAFTVDPDNLVTVDGTNPATAKEYELFDNIVQEFESRVSGITSEDMAHAREAARYR